MKGLDAALKVRTSRTIRSIEFFSSLVKPSRIGE